MEITWVDMKSIQWSWFTVLRYLEIKTTHFQDIFQKLYFGLDQSLTLKEIFFPWFNRVQFLCIIFFLIFIKLRSLFSFSFMIFRGICFSERWLWVTVSWFRLVACERVIHSKSRKPGLLFQQMPIDLFVLSAHVFWLHRDLISWLFMCHLPLA